MSSAAKYKKYDSITGDIISTIRNSYLGKPVDEEFLQDLKLLLENKMVAVERISPETFIPKISNSSNKLCFDPEDSKCLQTLPNEILVKIFGYFDIQDINRCAQVSHHFNMICEDVSLWKSFEKIYIEYKKVPSEFILKILSKGVKRIFMNYCEILPASLKFPKYLQLENLTLNNCYGEGVIFSKLLTRHPMEHIDLGNRIFSWRQMNKVIESLPKIGKGLKCLNFLNLDLPQYSTHWVDLIVKNCLDLEELNIAIGLPDYLITQLCENLPLNIVKLELNFGLFNDDHLRTVVKRCKKLQSLDIRYTAVSFNGLIDIVDNLQSLEYLAVSDDVGEEFGVTKITLGVTEEEEEEDEETVIDLSKVRPLRPMRQLKNLLVGYDLDCQEVMVQELVKELPNLVEHDGNNNFRTSETPLLNFREVECLKSTY